MLAEVVVRQGRAAPQPSERAGHVAREEARAP